MFSFKYVITDRILWLNLPCSDRRYVGAGLHLIRRPRLLQLHLGVVDNP
jgi:hypothetical protein